MRTAMGWGHWGCSEGERVTGNGKYWGTEGLVGAGVVCMWGVCACEVCGDGVCVCVRCGLPLLSTLDCRSYLGHAVIPLGCATFFTHV